MILERIAGERFSRILPLWVDYPVAIIAGGPSLTPDQVAQVGLAREADRLRVIAVNDAYLLAPWADLHYAADAKWHQWHAAGVAKPAIGLTADQVRERWQNFAGVKCSAQSHEDAPEHVHLMRNTHHPAHGLGLSRDPGALVSGRNSGFQAFNLAVLSGAKLLLLLGFDGALGKDGATHWHGGHPRPPHHRVYSEFRRAMSAAERDVEAMGVRVLNCSPGSAIDSWPKVPLTAALESLA